MTYQHFLHLNLIFTKMQWNLFDFTFLFSLFRRLFRAFLRIRWPIHWLLLLLYEQLCDFLFHCSIISTTEMSNHDNTARYRLWAHRLCDAFLHEQLIEGLVSHIGGQDSFSSGEGDAEEALILVKQELLLLRSLLLNSERNDKSIGSQQSSDSGLGLIVSAVRQLRRKIFECLEQSTYQSFIDSSLSRSGAVALTHANNRRQVCFVPRLSLFVLRNTRVENLSPYPT